MGCGASTTQVDAKQEQKYKERTRNTDLFEASVLSNPSLSSSTRKSIGSKEAAPENVETNNLSVEKETAGAPLTPRPPPSGISPRVASGVGTFGKLPPEPAQRVSSMCDGRGPQSFCCAFPEKRFQARFDPHAPEQRKLLSLLLSGDVTLKRPNHATRRSHTYSLDTLFLPDVTISLTDDELHRVVHPDRLGVHLSCTMERGTPLDLLAQRCVETRFKLGSLRWVAGYSRSFQSIALTQDLRLAAGLVAGGRKISPGMGETPMENSQNRYDYLSPTHHRRRQVEATEMSVSCIDMRTARNVGVLRVQDVRMFKEIAFVFGKSSDPCLVAAPPRGGMTVFSISRYSVLQEVPYEAESVDLGMITCMTVSRDSRFIAVGGQAFDDSGNIGGAVLVWATSEKGSKMQFHVERCFMEHTGVVTAIAFHTCEAIAASGDANGSIVLWNVETGRVYQKLQSHKQAVPRKLVFSGIGYLVSLVEGAMQCWKGEGDADSVDDRFRVVPLWRKLAHEYPLFASSDGQITDKEAETPRDDAPAVSETGEPTDAKYRAMYSLPGSAVLITTSSSCFIVLCAITGKVIDVVSTKAPIRSASVGRSLVLLSDTWGNLYSYDMQLEHELPTF